MDNPSPVNTESQNQNIPPQTLPESVPLVNTPIDTSNIPQPHQNPQISKPPKKALSVIIFLILIGAVVVGFLFYYLKYLKPKSPIISEQLNPTQTPTETPVKTATLYTNTKYYYDLLIPPAFNQEFIPDEVAHEERVVRFTKTLQDGKTSKVEVYMTSSKVLRDTISNLKKQLEKFDANQPIKDGSNTYSKIHISNFIAYQTEFEDEVGYKNTLLVKKDKWIYQIILETNDKNEISTLREIVTKINIYDSEAKFYID